MNKTHKKTSHSPRSAKDPNRYSKGWDRQRVQAVISHYEKQTDDQAVAEDEAAYLNSGMTMMGVPNDLVPKVQALIAKRSG